MVGDPVAFVVAETATQAKDAADLILIEYEPLAAVAHLEEAVLPDAPLVWSDCRAIYLCRAERGCRCCGIGVCAGYSRGS